MTVHKISVTKIVSGCKNSRYCVQKLPVHVAVCMQLLRLPCVNNLGT